MNDLVAIASASIAAVGLFFAGWQLLLLNRNATYERRVAYDGVVVSWRPVEAPDHPNHDGAAEWLYELTVNNPGRLPIDHVVVRWVFPCLVQRVRGSGVLDAPVAELTLGTPVLAGGNSRKWRRRVRIDFGQRGTLPDTFAKIRYMDIDGNEHCNRWPRRTDRARQ